MTTDSTERGLERLVCTALTGSACDPGPAEAGAVHERPAAYGAGWICGAPEDYDREYCVDLVQLTAYLRHGLKHGPHHLDKEVAKAGLECPPGLILTPSTASGRRTCRIRMPARRLHEPLGPRPRPRPRQIPLLDCAILHRRDPQVGFGLPHAPRRCQAKRGRRKAESSALKSLRSTSCAGVGDILCPSSSTGPCRFR